MSVFALVYKSLYIIYSIQVISLQYYNHFTWYQSINNPKLYFLFTRISS